MPATRMSLASIISDTKRQPMRVLVYGVDGIGKSTFAAQSEAPVFIGVEDGTAQLRTADGQPVKRFPQPHSWREVLDAIDTLTTSTHSYRTLVIDTLDWLEPLIWAAVVADAGRDKLGRAYKSIKDIPYGDGFVGALDEWRLLCSRLDTLRGARGMQVVLLAHTVIASFKNPEGDDFDRFELKLQNSKKTSAAGLMREWCDAVLFATHETYTHRADGDKRARAKGISTGARILKTERVAAYDAKNRYNLPPTLPLDWGAFREAVAAGETAPAGVLRARIEAALREAPTALAARVRAAVTAAADNATELARINNKLTAELSIAAEQETSHDD